MLQFIHLNYSRSISLDDIAEQAMVSKSTALNLFRKYLHITPVNYLINYRLKQAGQLLSKTEKKVSLISSETGFHNVDYFCRLFKKRYQLTPTKYRKQKSRWLERRCISGCHPRDSGQCLPQRGEEDRVSSACLTTFSVSSSVQSCMVPALPKLMQPTHSSEISITAAFKKSVLIFLREML